MQTDCNESIEERMMSDKDKISFNEGEEEEFHITDEDIDRELAAMEMDNATPGTDDVVIEEAGAGIKKPAATERFSKLKQLKRKHWIMIAIAVVILFFGLLKLFGSSPNASFDQITPVAVPSNPAVMPTKKTETDLTKTVFQPQSSSPTADSLLAAPTLSTSNSVNQSQLKTDLTTLAGNESKLVATLDVIQQQNKMLTQQLATLSSRVQGLESSFSLSNQAVEGLSHQGARMKPADQSSSFLAPKPPEAAPEGPHYTVEAVVPQRAWLQTSDGSTMTVMMGDEVPHLGTVVAIDPYSGNVTTSSGTVIKYGN
jgi:hypothetical protein